MIPLDGLPLLNPTDMVKRLLEMELISEKDLISILGETRHHLTVPDLERAILRESILSDGKLAELKGSVSGYEFLETTDVATRSDGIDAETSRKIGAVLLDTDPLAVALVEDLPSSVELLNFRFENYKIVAATTNQIAQLYKKTYTKDKLTELSPLGDIYQIFDEAIRKNASDIHLSVGNSPSLRVDGSLNFLSRQPVDLAWMRSEILRICGAERLARAEAEHDVDMAFPYGAARFRVNLGADRKGLTLAARKIPSRVPTMEEISLPRAVQNFINLDRGLVLVTGATGSGKSTTLAAVLASISTTQKRHIITLEDPIEFILPSGKSVIHQREAGSSFTTFPGGLRQALRQDPDVILVGEMRDLDTIRTAVTAAETGHLVFGTLHTYDAASTIARIVAMYPTEEQDQIRATLSYTLKGIVSQVLLPTLGKQGRVAAFEILVSNAAVANNLRKIDGLTQIKSTIETGVNEGMQTLDMALADLVKKRLTSEEHALEKVVDVKEFMRRLKE